MSKHAPARTPVELGQPFAEEIRRVIDGSNQPSQQKPGAGMAFAGRLCGEHCVQWRDLLNITGDGQVFENFTPTETHQPGLEGTEMG